ncbi:MAG: polysaccharide biosynthesis C-terminal domain-containing protein [Candidatus Levyibacteriota bacterium]
MRFDLLEAARVFGNAFSQLTIRLAGGLTTFLITLLIVSSLGLFTLGSFVKVTAFVALFYLIVDFGLNTIYLRDYFKEIEQYFGNLLSLRLVIAGLAYILILGITYVLPSGLNVGFSPSEKIGIIIFSLTLFTEAVLLSFSGLVQKKLLQRSLLVPTIVSSLFVLLAVYYSVKINNLNLIFLAYPLGDIIQIILIFLFVKRAFDFSLLPVDFRSFSGKTIRASGPIALMLLLNVVYFRIDTVILSIYKSTIDVGIYGFSYKIFEFLIAFPTFLSASVFPILILSKDDTAQFRNKVRSYSYILFLFSLCISAVVFLGAPVISLLRENLDSAILPLRILCFSLPFFFLTSLFQWVLLLRNRIKFLVITYAVTMVINILLDVIFIPVLSYNGAATITVITEGIVFCCMISALLLGKRLHR